MRAFIIRPFGKKKVLQESGKTLEIDFDAVQKKLIDPALEDQEQRIDGRTTEDIAKAGNIRTDMFEQILVADLVIADISIHNANVFYELGIRHALRDRMTILIRSRVPSQDVPFDLKTDRYLEYDYLKPKKSLKKLKKVVGQTIKAKQGDSPVHQLVPELEPVDPQKILVVPREFSEAVDRAAKEVDVARLGELAEEAKGLPWEVSGMREVGRAQFHLKDHEGARASLEFVRNLFEDDIEANTLLGTVYQRLGDMVGSWQALERVLNSREPDPYARAEARALRARNEKTQWEEKWKDSPDLGERQMAALRSPHLVASFDEYRAAFREDRNHFYSGLNALAMARFLLGLAEQHPDVWAERFIEEAEASAELRSYENVAAEFEASVRLSIDSGLERLEREEADELVWAKVSKADLAFLTIPKPTAVSHAYLTALAGAKDFVGDSVRKQARLFESLDLYADNAREVLAAIPEKD